MAAFGEDGAALGGGQYGGNRRRQPRRGGGGGGGGGGGYRVRRPSAAEAHDGKLTRVAGRSAPTASGGLSLIRT